VTYNEAIQELETILRSLETDQVDVDDLTARAERSAELIRLCRHKLRHAEASLDRVFDSLDDEEETDLEEDEEPEDNQEEEDDLDEEDEDEDDTDDYQPGGPGRPAQPRLF
jgi:exodeoxyribonuclease VII small subunit